MAEYYARSKPLVHHEPRAFDRNARKDWRNEFMKSLTYELTTVYADQIVNSIQSRKERDMHASVHTGKGPYSKALMNRIRSERGGDKMEEQLLGKDPRGRTSTTKQIVRELGIDKELYFERHIDINGMEQKI